MFLVICGAAMRIQASHMWTTTLQTLKTILIEIRNGNAAGDPSSRPIPSRYRLPEVKLFFKLETEIAFPGKHTAKAQHLTTTPTRMIWRPCLRRRRTHIDIRKMITENTPEGPVIAATHPQPPSEWSTIVAPTIEEVRLELCELQQRSRELQQRLERIERQRRETQSPIASAWTPGLRQRTRKLRQRLERIERQRRETQSPIASAWI
ncbi:hypothetical protein C8J57DRAFT_1519326 [Mycena rebaudengoi]|nr:hypothetical protein C8J57DRAFT_1519326 [Mycena rebaudengoi]